MIQADTRTEIGNFLLLVDEPFDMVQRPSFEGQARVHDQLVAQPLGLEDQTRRDILMKMGECWENEQDYDRIRDWGRVMVGTATLLAFDQEEETNRHWTLTADVIVRLAHWLCSTHPFYTPMNEYAQDIVGSIWEQMPDLYGQYGDSKRIVYYQGNAYRLKKFGPKNSRIWITENDTDLRPSNELFVDPQMSRPLNRQSFDGDLSREELLRIINFDSETRQAI